MNKSINMKFTITLCFAFLLIFSSCEKSEDFQEFNLSEQKWQNFKNENNNSYLYIESTSSWTGTQTDLEVLVKNGKIINRKFRAYTFNDRNSNDTTVLESWDEKENEIHQHEDRIKSLTLDELYKDTKQKLTGAGRIKNFMFLSENNGMISLAGYILDNCADDCFVGKRISLIRHIK